jgi:hypothetical protein
LGTEVGFAYQSPPPLYFKIANLYEGFVELTNETVSTTIINPNINFNLFIYVKKNIHKPQIISGDLDSQKNKKPS